MPMQLVVVDLGPDEEGATVLTYSFAPAVSVQENA
jgi:hypothetical protein